MDDVLFLASYFVISICFALLFSSFALSHTAVVKNVGSRNNLFGLGSITC